VERSYEGRGDQSRALFIQKLRSNPGYIRLICRPDSDPGRRERFEEFCWRAHRTALRNELKGRRAKRALEHLQALRTTIGDPCWVPPEIVESLDELERDLKDLASKIKRGRPTDIVGTWFRQVIHHFAPARSSRKTALSIPWEEIDEILAEVLSTVLARTISATSVTRMRMRDRARSKQSEILTLCPLLKRDSCETESILAG
jgi:hypothetical protein